MARVTQVDMLGKISKRIVKRADDAYNPNDEPDDSDGLDQAERDGLMQALAIVEEEFAKHKIVM